MKSPTINRRFSSYPRVMLAIIGVGVVIGGVGAAAIALGAGDKIAISAAMGLAAAGVALWFSWRWWAAIDEAVREAHKISWFWGGSTGMGLVAALCPMLLVISRGDAPQLGLAPTEAGFMLAGVAVSCVTMLVGYGLFWAGWWISRGR